jgi:hypothetical protein
MSICFHKIIINRWRKREKLSQPAMQAARGIIDDFSCAKRENYAMLQQLRQQNY